MNKRSVSIQMMCFLILLIAAPSFAKTKTQKQADAYTKSHPAPVTLGKKGK